MNNWANGFDPAVHIDKLEATIAQQQARIEALKSEVFVQKGLVTVARVLTDKAEQALAAERERADFWSGMHDARMADLNELGDQLQAERERVEELQDKLRPIDDVRKERDQFNFVS